MVNGNNHDVRVHGLRQFAFFGLPFVLELWRISDQYAVRMTNDDDDGLGYTAIIAHGTFAQLNPSSLRCAMVIPREIHRARRRICRAHRFVFLAQPSLSRASYDTLGWTVVPSSPMNPRCARETKSRLSRRCSLALLGTHESRDVSPAPRLMRSAPSTRRPTHPNLHGPRRHPRPFRQPGPFLTTRQRVDHIRILQDLQLFRARPPSFLLFRRGSGRGALGWRGHAW